MFTPFDIVNFAYHGLVLKVVLAAVAEEIKPEAIVRVLFCNQALRSPHLCISRAEKSHFVSLLKTSAPS